MLAYLKKIITSQKKLYFLLLMILMTLAALEYLLLGIYSSFNLTVEQFILRVIPGIAIGVSFFLTLVINNYFVENKNEEFSIILLSGSKTKEVLLYIIIQFGSLLLIADVLGFGIGALLLEIINQLPGVYFNYNLSTIIFTFSGLFVCKLVYIFTLNFGKFIRIKLNLADYLTNHTSLTSKVNYFSSELLTNGQAGKFPWNLMLQTILGVLFLVFSIQGLWEDNNVAGLAMYYALFLVGELMLINNAFPLLYDFYHNRLLQAPKLIMILGNVLSLSKVLASMINILAVVIPLCLLNFFIQTLVGSSLAMVIICFYVFLLMLFLSFILRFKIYLPTITTDIATLRALGYRYQQICAIYRGVVYSFMLIVLVLPLVLYSLLLYRAYVLSYVSLKVMLVLIVSYLIVFLILGLFMLLQYYSTIKEAYHDVKYLNRSE